MHPLDLVAGLAGWARTMRGSWLVHQAYAAGPPEVVLAFLAVLDPIVAVVLGLVLLGEGSGLGPGTAIAMALDRFEEVYAQVLDRRDVTPGGRPDAPRAGGDSVDVIAG